MSPFQYCPRKTSKKCRIPKEDESDDHGQTVQLQETGVLQGSVLSPHLFVIFTSDLPRTERTSMALYADDTALIARPWRVAIATRRLQEAVSLMEDWCNNWKVPVNAEKSKAILFRKVRKETPTGHISMYGEEIQWHDKVRYLGVIMDKGLTWR